MSDIISYSPVRALDGNGDPVPGALARFFISNTTTPATVFADVAEQVPHPVPLEADGNGVFPPVYRSGQALRVVMTDADGVTLPGFPLDPVISVAADGGAASQVSFDPTAEIPETNVQAAIQRVQSNLVAPLLDGGIGVTGDAPTLANVDATNTASGFYRWTDSATGTLPPGWAGESGTIWLFRENVNNAVQFIARRDNGALFYRALEAGTWQAWTRYDLRSLPDADWEAGTSETFASPSPAQIGKAIQELAQSALTELSQGQVEDDEDDTFGLVSGERLDQQTRSALNASGDPPMFACRAWVSFDGTTTPPNINGSGNVSQVSREGAGDYTITFDEPMPDTAYVVTGLVGPGANADGIILGNAPTTSSIRIRTTTPSAGAQNKSRVHVAVFR